MHQWVYNTSLSELNALLDWFPTIDFSNTQWPTANGLKVLITSCVLSKIATYVTKWFFYNHFLFHSADSFCTYKSWKSTFPFWGCFQFAIRTKNTQKSLEGCVSIHQIIPLRNYWKESSKPDRLSFSSFTLV